MSKTGLFALSFTVGALLMIASQSRAQMSQGCGAAPQPPIGMYYLCVCDNMGNNCQLVLVTKK